MTTANPSKRAIADAKRDLALHALLAHEKTPLAREHAAAWIACVEWARAERLAGRVPA
jgi:hypothetical protein